MLTEEHYTALWRNPAPHGFGQTHAMPSYHEYCIRENQIQDYLDIFRGRSTRNSRHPNENDHPFQIYLVKKPDPLTIKYIMIGEAAPPLNPIINRINDRQNTFFYNPNHLGPTQYFSAPCNAFDIDPRLSKLEKLLALAQKGVLLLDLFPFAVSYSTDLRKSYLNKSGVTDYFWLNANDSIRERIHNLLAEKLMNDDDDVKVAFITPPTISHHIMFKIRNDISFNLNQFINTESNTEADLIEDNWKIRWNDTEVPFFKCCTVIKPRSGPDADLIRNAFGLLD